MATSFTYKITGYHTITVEEDDLDEATKEADKIINEVDFGYLEDINAECIDIT